MFDRTLDPDTVKWRLAPLTAEFDDQVIPEQVELLKNNAYAANYAWMYSFEKQLKYRVEAVLGFKLHHVQERVLFGSGGAFSEGLSNAFAHGHAKDTSRVITVWTAVSAKGLGFSITDQGAGFDFDQVMTQFKGKRMFFHIAGNGFSRLHRSPAVHANYRENGRQLCLLFSFGDR